MNRRSVLRLLGLAPVAAPAALAAASAKPMQSIDYSALSTRLAERERNFAALEAAVYERVDGVGARVEGTIASETDARASAGDALATRLTTVTQRIVAAEGRIGMLVTTVVG